MTAINPNFNILNTPSTFTNHLQQLTQPQKAISHRDVLEKLLEQIEPLDFQLLAYPEVKQLREQLVKLKPDAPKVKELQKQIDSKKLNNKHYLILCIENLLKVAAKNRWGLCKHHDFIYVYNGQYWANIDTENFQKFLGKVAEKMGVLWSNARYYKFKEELYKQFIATAYLPSPENSQDRVLINLANGTFEINAPNKKLRSFNSTDFITYQLPFSYEPEAKAPIFEKYLNRVLPEKEKQLVLAEYLGFVFIRHGSKVLKEEKALILYGTGANGKSVFFEIVNALIGAESISHFSLQNLTNDNGYHRAKLANKLVNYASEINGKLEAATFKQLVSGEPVEARLPYGKPFTLTQYAKLIFNCNELPKEVEHTNAFFRRFLIVPFEVTIPSNEQDKTLHTKIIESELAGVFNWVLAGLDRLLTQKRFTECKAVKNALKQYKVQSDNVQLFMIEIGYEKSPTKHELVSKLYLEYRSFCQDDGFRPLSKSNFKKRLEAVGVLIERKNIGNVAYLIKASKNP